MNCRQQGPSPTRRRNTEFEPGRKASLAVRTQLQSMSAPTNESFNGAYGSAVEWCGPARQTHSTHLCVPMPPRWRTSTNLSQHPRRISDGPSMAHAESAPDPCPL